MTQASVLDTAGQVSRRVRPVERRTDRSRGIFLRESIAANESGLVEVTLQWRPALAAQRNRIADHYAANRWGTFDVNLPGGETVAVQYDGPPRFTRRGPEAFDVTVTLLQAFARSH